MRLLVVSHPPLDARLGAAQFAMELSQALRDRGHDVVTWSPSPLSAGARGFRASIEQSARLEALLVRSPPFDVIDLPAISLTPAVARYGFTVTRSVQSDLAYLEHDLRSEFRRLSPRLPRSLVNAWRARRAIISGWSRASAILCLGSLEKAWMSSRFPRWESKLFHYVASPSAKMREHLLAVRSNRSRTTQPEVRVLWLGRWAAHKGVDRLTRWIADTRRMGGPPITLAGCGELPLRTLPKDWIADGSVRVVPRYTREELLPLLAGHSVGLFTSSVEGWGISLNEMLESGQTVYATSAGGVPDLSPYFPRTLRPLESTSLFDVAIPEDLASSDYLTTFSWPAIARRYEEEVLASKAR